MVGLCYAVVNSKGQKAFVGDKVKLDLLVQGWMSNKQVYTITDIRIDGTVILDNYIGQHISGIKNFEIVR